MLKSVLIANRGEITGRVIRIAHRLGVRTVAGTAAIETIFPRTYDPDSLAACVARARRNGFTGMMPSTRRGSRRSTRASPQRRMRSLMPARLLTLLPPLRESEPCGWMIDRPHLVQAHRILVSEV